MNISKLRGMRYPDEYLVRMFYKENLNQNTGQVLELGCGSCNNLLHFAAYGWSVTGLDYDANSIAEGRFNLMQSEMSGHLIEHDLNKGLPHLESMFDVLLCPSTLYYINREAAWNVLSSTKAVLNAGALVYLRMRLPDDHRSGRGTPEGTGAWRLDIDYTGEFGALNVFWNQEELEELLEETLGMNSDRLTKLRITYENIQNGQLIRNSDIVLWGHLP
jgi:SAM-dependent methyltransferase